MLVLAGIGLFVVRPAVRDALRGYHSTHGSTVVRFTLRSSLLHLDLPEVAVIPPGGGRRPLLVFLHGRQDGYQADPLPHHLGGPKGMLSDSLFEAIAALGPRAPVVVFPNGNGHSWYHDRRSGRWGSMILKEAIPDAVQRFHTLPGRIAIGGISMGGYGAIYLAGVDPGVFCAAGGHSAAIWEPRADWWPLGAFDDQADFDRHDVFALASAGRYGSLPVWLDVGTEDVLRVADAAFASTLRRHGVAVTFHMWPGGHVGSYWHTHMRAYLEFYANALAHCRGIR